MSACCAVVKLMFAASWPSAAQLRSEPTASTQVSAAAHSATALAMPDWSSDLHESEFGVKAWLCAPTLQQNAFSPQKTGVHRILRMLV